MATQKLQEYRRKRDEKQTPEPFGKGKKRGKQPIFVIQRHDARRLHYDFRLERDGALASWAVPKGVPLEPGRRADGAPAWQAARGHLDACPGTPRRRREELAAAEETGRAWPAAEAHARV